MRDELAVAIDVGSRRHRVGVETPGEGIVEEFEIDHDRAGFEEFFRRVEKQRDRTGLPVVVAMEGRGGWARPLDGMVLDRGYELLNVNNLKLARFKEIFPSPAKSDSIDTRKMLELMRMRYQLSMSRNVLERVVRADEVNQRLKRLTRRRRQLVVEKTRILGRLYADLSATSPGLAAITGEIGNRWFLEFVASREDLRQLARMRAATLLKIRAVGRKRTAEIQAWQPTASFSHDVEWVGPMIVSDARRALELIDQIQMLEDEIGRVGQDSAMAQQIDSIPGFGLVCSAELAGEIETIARFRGESGLAMYIGMAVLDDSSGTREGSRRSRQVNVRAKNAMMTAVMRHIEQVPQSRSYYDKKRTEGKTHNQAIRSLGRHLARVIWAMLTESRNYEIRKINS